MGRRMQNLAGGGSVVCLLGVLAAWGAGPWMADGGHGKWEQVRGTPVEASWFVASRGGAVRVMRQRVEAVNASSRLGADGRRLGFLYLRQDGNVIGTVRHGSLEPTRRVLGFGWGGHVFSKTMVLWAPEMIGGVFRLRYDVVEVPYWALVGVTGVVPAAWGRGWWVRRRRVARGWCVGCGYDLRGTPGRCPECGLVRG